MATLATVSANLVRRVDCTVAYLRSFFDDPVANGKGSMARLVAFLAMLGALSTTKALVSFAGAHEDKTAMAGILAGAATTLGATIVLGLLLRKKSDGSSEPVDDGGVQ